MTIAVRSGANVVPLTLAGLPIQYVAYWVRQLPRAMQEGAVALVRLMTGLRGAQVLPRSSHSPLDAIPVTGFQLADAISEGLIDVRSGVAELTADGARGSGPLHPLREEDVRLVWRGPVAVRRPDEMRAVG